MTGRTARYVLRSAVLTVASFVALLIPTTPAFAPCHAITFADDPYTVGEGAGKVTVTVSNGAGAQTTNQMVDYRTINGTAKAGSDYSQTDGTVTIPTGATEATFEVPITNDTKDEPSEEFTVELSNVRPASSCVPPPGITQDTATVTITDNDPKPVVQPTQTQASSPKPKASTSSPTPKATKTPNPTPTATSTSPSPSPTATVLATGADDDGGISGGAIGGIIAAVIVVGGGAAFLVRRRFLT